MVNFFQYLTQAATKVDRRCVVASLLASDPTKRFLRRQLQSEPISSSGSARRP